MTNQQMMDDIVARIGILGALSCLASSASTIETEFVNDATCSRAIIQLADEYDALEEEDGG